MFIWKTWDERGSDIAVWQQCDWPVLLYHLVALVVHSVCVVHIGWPISAKSTVPFSVPSEVLHHLVWPKLVISFHHACVSIDMKVVKYALFSIHFYVDMTAWSDEIKWLILPKLLRLLKNRIHSIMHKYKLDLENEGTNFGQKNVYLN